MGKTETAADLLAAVLADPGNDLPRLVLADWWEEHGEPERAEFCRVQIELAKPHVERTGYQPGGGARAAKAVDDALRRRERELLEKQCGWFPACLNGSICENLSEMLRRDMPSFIVRRGFIAEWQGPLAAWVGGPCGRCEGRRNVPFKVRDDQGWAMKACSACSGSGRTAGHGPALVRQHPVERVTTGREPQPSVQFPGLFRWFSHADGDRSEIGPDLYSLLRSSMSLEYASQPYWPTRAAALDALSAACIAWAKSTPADAAARGG